MKDIKIKLNVGASNNTFIVGNKYIFTPQYDDSYKLEFKFLSNSRIDGWPLFSVPKGIYKCSLAKLKYGNILVDLVELVSVPSDHCSEYDKNKRKVINFLLSLHSIEYDDFFIENCADSIIRDIKINTLIN